MTTSRPVAEVLAEPVFADGETKPFGDLTAADVRARAGELAGAVGWGPTARVAPVAQAWSELASTMERQGAATVADLDPQAVAERAERLWVVPPGGSLLR